MRGRCPICLAILAIRPEILAPPVSEFGVQCGRDVGVVAACTVYLDKILIVGTRRAVRKAVHRSRQRLQRVGFVISQKSVTEPARDLDLVGKVFDLKRGTLENRPRMLRGLVRLWLLLVMGLLNRKGMERLLGRLEWALRPSVGLSPFLAGAYC